MRRERRFSTVQRLTLLLVSVVLVGAGCGGADLVAPDPVVIEVWRTDSTQDDFAEAMGAYSATYPHVSFSYRTFKPDEYIDELFEAWSKGEGPDVFSVPNYRMGQFKEFAAPMPAQVTLRRTYQERSFGKTQTIVEDRTTILPTENQMRDRFVGAVAGDVVFEEQIYGMPMHFDTMVLYYNRDLLSRAGVAVPPTTWEEFRNAVQAMTVLDDAKEIVLPAAALGTAENVQHFFDILSVLMMQNGTPIVNERGSVVFGAEDDNGRNPALEALEFYSKFSDDRFATYTWNDEQLNSLEAFTQGTLGFYFGYHADLAEIEKRAPNLNFSYTKLPQIDTGNPVNYARYQVESVHLGSDAIEHSWNFINFATAQDQARSYLDSTGKVSALNTIVGESQFDPTLGPFAQQALTAKTWYHGVDPETAILAFQEMIQQWNNGEGEIEEIIGLAARKVRETLTKE